MNHKVCHSVNLIRPAVHCDIVLVYRHYPTLFLAMRVAGLSKSPTTSPVELRAQSTLTQATPMKAHQELPTFQTMMRGEKCLRYTCTWCHEKPCRFCGT